MLNFPPVMDFSLTDDQLLIRDTVRDFMNTEVRPHVKAWERTDHFPLDAIRKLGELGCCGMLMPEEWGGPGLDTISYVLMLEEVAKVHTAMSTALGVTNSAVQLPLLAHGTQAQKERYLRRLASGEIIGSFCLTEPAAGSDAAGIQTRAERLCSGRTLVRPSESASVSDGVRSPTSFSPSSNATEGTRGRSFRSDINQTSESGASAPEEMVSSPTHYKLNGTKTWVTNGSHASLYIIFAKTDPGAGGKGITAFLVEPNTPGLKIGRHEDKMGQRSSPSVEILLNNCIVPAENRLGEEGAGLKIALSALDGGRIGIAAQAVGLAQGALDESVKYAKVRKAFNKPISEFQAIQWMLADMHTEIEAARALLYQAAFLKDLNSPTTQIRHSERSPRSEERFSTARPLCDESLLSSNATAGTGGRSFSSDINQASKVRASAPEELPSSCARHAKMGSAASRAKLYASEMVNRVVYKAVQIHGSLGYSRESEVERMYRDARVISIYEGTSEIQRTIIARDLLK
ncbi:MAG: acyl-CoA dehydrogenase family protein [Candidatus Acidiferrum sp.]